MTTATTSGLVVSAIVKLFLQRTPGSAQDRGALMRQRSVLLVVLAECAAALEAEVLAAGDLDHPIIQRHASLAARVRQILASEERPARPKATVP